MVQPQPHPGDESSKYDDEDWLVRQIREHIARGNRPDWERAEKLSREIDEIVAKNGPSPLLAGLSDEEIDQLAVDLVREVRREGSVPRHSIAWPFE